MTTSIESPSITLDSYLTDGKALFQVVDLVPGKAVLLENVNGGELLWQAMEELVSPSLRSIVPIDSVS